MTLLELFALLKKHLKLVISLPIACALATAVFSWAFLPNTYTSTVSMYVLTRANENTSVLTSTCRAGCLTPAPTTRLPPPGSTAI